MHAIIGIILNVVKMLNVFASWLRRQQMLTCLILKTRWVSMQRCRCGHDVYIVYMYMHICMTSDLQQWMCMRLGCLLSLLLFSFTRISHSSFAASSSHSCSFPSSLRSLSICVHTLLHLSLSVSSSSSPSSVLLSQDGKKALDYLRPENRIPNPSEHVSDDDYAMLQVSHHILYSPLCLFDCLIVNSEIICCHCD